MCKLFDGDQLDGWLYILRVEVVTRILAALFALGVVGLSLIPGAFEGGWTICVLSKATGDFKSHLHTQ